MRIFKLAGSNFFLGWIMTSMIYLALLAVLFSTVSTLSFDKWRSATRDLVTIHVPNPTERIASDDDASEEASEAASKSWDRFRCLHFKFALESIPDFVSLSLGALSPGSLY